MTFDETKRAAREYLQEVLEIKEKEAEALVNAGYLDCTSIVNDPESYLYGFCGLKSIKTAGIYSAVKVIAESE